MITSKQTDKVKQMKTFFSTMIELSDLDWFMVDVIGISVILLVAGIVLIKRK